MNSFRSGPIVATSVVVLALLAGLAIVFHGSASDMFMPHAHCYLFNEKLMLLHGGSDLFIGLSYLAISATIGWLVHRSRRDLPFHWMMLAFALFIVACGTTHFMEVWTLRAPNPPYWISGWAKFVTALASVLTAVFLIPLVPKVRALLESARRSSERKDELEKAYAALDELYRKSAGSHSRSAAGERQDLAQMAKEVSVHARVLEQAKETAEAANRAKDQFLAMLSHELRTPLTPALAAASNLETAEHIDPGELREALGSIRRNIELEARLVDDLLDLTRISKGKIEIHSSTINLHETVEHAAEMCRSEAHQKGNEFQVALDAREHHVSGDGARLAQIVWNLLLNAVKFTPAKGEISVRTSNPHLGAVRIEVCDSGIGIEPDMLPRIFEPFNQGDESTTRRYGGLGLGLSIAHGLVTAHGGTITARSEGKGKGTSFVIDLATTVPPAAPKDSGFTQPAPQHLTWRILLAEDHADTRQAIERLLSRWGHEVQSAATVAEAVELAGTFQPDLLLSDIGLPDGTGIDLLGKIRHDRPLHAIAMSGFGMEADLEMSRHAGFAEHLIKPVSAERLKEALARVAAHPKA